MSSRTSGVILREDGGRAEVRFTRDWSRVRCLDADADTDLLEGLEAELTIRLERDATAGSTLKPMMDVLADTLSNCVQMTEMRGTLAESFPAEMEQLLRDVRGAFEGATEQEGRNGAGFWAARGATADANGV